MDAIELSKYLINKSIEEDHPINNYQLQKILYLIQKKCLDILEEPIFFESFEAWMIGPVIPLVYYKWCGFGPAPITISCKYEKPPEKYLEIVNKMLREKRALDVWQLIEEAKDDAWNITRDNGWKIIPMEFMTQFKCLKFTQRSDTFKKRMHVLADSVAGLKNFMEYVQNDELLTDFENELFDNWRSRLYFTLKEMEDYSLRTEGTQR